MCRDPKNSGTLWKHDGMDNDAQWVISEYRDFFPVSIGHGFMVSHMNYARESCFRPEESPLASSTVGNVTNVAVDDSVSNINDDYDYGGNDDGGGDMMSVDGLENEGKGENDGFLLPSRHRPGPHIRHSSQSASASASSSSSSLPPSFLKSLSLSPDSLHVVIKASGDSLSPFLRSFFLYQRGITHLLHVSLLQIVAITKSNCTLIHSSQTTTYLFPVS
jgi:hypothetical protein